MVAPQTDDQRMDAAFEDDWGFWSRHVPPSMECERLVAVVWWQRGWAAARRHHQAIEERHREAAAKDDETRAVLLGLLRGYATQRHPDNWGTCSICTSEWNVGKGESETHHASCPLSVFAAPQEPA